MARACRWCTRARKTANTRHRNNNAISAHTAGCRNIVGIGVILPHDDRVSWRGPPPATLRGLNQKVAAGLKRPSRIASNMLVAFGSDNLWTAEGRFRERSAIAWEIPAWLATPDTSIPKAVLLTGDGANGTYTCRRAVLAVAFGSDNLWTAEGRFRERS